LEVPATVDQRIEETDPRLAITLVGVPVPNVSVIFSVQL
jgi:hypothetical protein